MQGQGVARRIHVDNRGFCFHGEEAFYEVLDVLWKRWRWTRRIDLVRPVVLSTERNPSQLFIQILRGSKRLVHSLVLWLEYQSCGWATKI